MFSKDSAQDTALTVPLQPLNKSITMSEIRYKNLKMSTIPKKKCKNNQERTIKLSSI